VSLISTATAQRCGRCLCVLSSSSERAAAF